MSLCVITERIFFPCSRNVLPCKECRLSNLTKAQHHCIYTVRYKKGVMIMHTSFIVGLGLQYIYCIGFFT